MAVRCFSAVSKGCHSVYHLLRNEAMVAEQSLLHSIMYSFHYQMNHHRPYRSLKQVEQCLKRFKIMNLEKAIQDLVQAGPVKHNSENAEECLVPSQPVIEVVLVKILGGCKLVLRLLECCCTGFLLSVKHLCLQEYILLNTLVVGLLSRLWILFKGVLKSLGSLYKSLFELLQEVSNMQPRPYIEGFAFPSVINEFLGAPYSEIKKKMPKALVMKKAGTGWLNRLFSGSKPGSLSTAVPKRVMKKMRRAQNNTDIGKPVLVNRTNLDLEKEFDIKTLCRHPSPAMQENTKSRENPSGSKRTPKSLSSKSLKAQHLRSFVPKLQEASSFRELSDTLKTTILWCKSNRLGSEAFFLGMKLLKSKRLQHVEAQGCSLRRKLGCVKATLCKYLQLTSCKWRPSQILRVQSHLRRRIKLSKKRRCNLKRSLFCIPPPETDTLLLENSLSCSLGQWSNDSSQVWTTENSHSNETVEEQARGNASHLVKERSLSHRQKGATENSDDIDDIFKVIGL
ncbi:nucleolus and neural progenitor protein isoform X2 [Varanus komodoensis]|uniref:Nucleolus and neural progenitor protein n=1 Tax=Varanus komodoensis TaxID=61221 RepID=A0A8D2LTE2_VARKO|nr:nucleolus and neural progenitor protein isoform X2 [Varanus komodoensis]XP_044297913.1 nucleolus and neural progenitor protein isoform X2 [Varanus komodoensis]